VTLNPEVSRLYAAWRRLGVNFSGTSCTEMVEVEPLILATAAVAGADERLTSFLPGDNVVAGNRSSRWRRPRANRDGVPTGIRTPVASVKGMCPRPLDDGDAGQRIDRSRHQNWWSQAGSNRRPLACHASALPAELWPHMEARHVTRGAPIRQGNERTTLPRSPAPYSIEPGTRFSPKWSAWRRSAEIPFRRTRRGEWAARACRERSPSRPQSH
jgi:hypothetical protein